MVGRVAVRRHPTSFSLTSVASFGNSTEGVFWNSGTGALGHERQLEALGIGLVHRDVSLAPGRRGDVVSFFTRPVVAQLGRSSLDGFAGGMSGDRCSVSVTVLDVTGVTGHPVKI